MGISRGVGSPSTRGSRSARPDAGLDQVVIGRLAGVGPLRPVAAAVHVDDVRPHRLDRRVVEAQPGQTVVADRGGEHVAGRHKSAQRLRVAWLLKVQKHRTLVAVDRHEKSARGRPAPPRGGCPAQRMMSPPPPRPSAGKLHLDHVRALVAEHLGGVGAEHHAGHVEDAHALQRTRGFIGQFVSVRQRFLHGHDVGDFPPLQRPAYSGKIERPRWRASQARERGMDFELGRRASHAQGSGASFRR